jgi:TusA-related sulfurtransferase
VSSPSAPEPTEPEPDGRAEPTEPEPIDVDARGRRCPLPVIDLARAASLAPRGALIEVLADDPAATSDIPAWCRMRGHTYLEVLPIDAPAEEGGPGAVNVHRIRLR